MPPHTLPLVTSRVRCVRIPPAPKPCDCGVVPVPLYCATCACLRDLFCPPPRARARSHGPVLLHACAPAPSLGVVFPVPPLEAASHVPGSNPMSHVPGAGGAAAQPAAPSSTTATTNHGPGMRRQSVVWCSPRCSFVLMVCVCVCVRVRVWSDTHGLPWREYLKSLGCACCGGGCVLGADVLSRIAPSDPNVLHQVHG